MDQAAIPNSLPQQPPQSTPPPLMAKKNSKISLFLLIGMILFILLIIGEVIYLTMSGTDLPLLIREEPPKQTQTPLPTKTPSGNDIAGENNTKRKSDIVLILDALSQYQIENQGKLPEGITTETKAISSTGANICSSLVPFSIAALPIDPLTSAERGLVTDCNGAYDTGYDISASETNTIIITAPNAELGETISVTR
jgi:hypothetical protein